MSNAVQSAGARDGSAGRGLAAWSTAEAIGLLLHDIRNPLSAARGYLSLMRISPSGPTTQDLEAAEECIDSALALMDQVVELARIEKGQSRMYPRPLDVPGMVEATVAHLGPVASRMGRTLTFVGCPAPAMALADGDLAGKVVAELVSGALKHASSSVTVAVAERPGDGLVEIRVLDDGVPVAEEMLEALFDAAAQVGLREAASRRGMGLSLPFARAACAAMGGSVRAESPGGGLSVVVTLQAAMAGGSVHGRGPRPTSRKGALASWAQ